MAAVVTIALTMSSFALGAVAPTPAAQSTASDVTGTPASEICPVDANNVPTAAASAGSVFTIAGDTSQASYSVNEELTGQGAVNAVGTTNALIGTILLDDSGAPIPYSIVYVDLRTLTTNEDRRDNQVQKVLETSEYPLGAFVITSFEGITGAINDGADHTFKIVGDLTVHGVTRTTTWDATVKVDGDTLTGTATTTITFGDFGMEAPAFGPVASIEDEFQLSMDLSAAR